MFCGFPTCFDHSSSSSTLTMTSCIKREQFIFITWPSSNILSSLINLDFLNNTSSKHLTSPVLQVLHPFPIYCVCTAWPPVLLSIVHSLYIFVQSSCRTSEFAKMSYSSSFIFPFLFYNINFLIHSFHLIQHLPELGQQGDWFVFPIFLGKLSVLLSSILLTTPPFWDTFYISSAYLPFTLPIHI